MAQLLIATRLESPQTVTIHDTQYDHIQLPWTLLPISGRNHFQLRMFLSKIRHHISQALSPSTEHMTPSPALDPEFPRPVRQSPNALYGSCGAPVLRTQPVTPDGDGHEVWNMVKKKLEWHFPHFVLVGHAPVDVVVETSTVVQPHGRVTDSGTPPN